MKQLNITKVNWNELEDLITEYFTELGYKNDGFHNCKIFGGKAYELLVGEERVGFIALATNKNQENILHAFYVVPAKRGMSMELFNQVMTEFEVKAALVASNDAPFVSLAFEEMNKRKTTFDMQAFNFIYGEPLRPARYGMEHLIEIKPEEYDAVEQVTDGLWTGCFGNPAYSFYAIKSGEEILGYGSMATIEHNDRNVDVGNFVLPNHRREGVGRSLIINLGKLAIAKGFEPVAGCWYKNAESILTLKSSGMIPENRLFYVRF